MKKIITLILVLSLFSCKEKNEEQNNEDQQVVEEVTNPNFSVDVTAIASKKDAFALYFSEDNTVNFNQENVIWAEINQNELSNLNFEIKEERIPTHIRLDFGLNKEQDSVVIRKIKMSYLKNSFEFKGSDFFQYFNQDSIFKTAVNVSKGTLTIYKEGSEYKTPFFYPNEILVDKIREISFPSTEVK